jgi:KaiC/GvpD/RAD55 family RecA-like ATPase
MYRDSTSIPEFHELIGNEALDNDVILLTGGLESGIATFEVQFLCEGVIGNGELKAYTTMEERRAHRFQPR